MKDKFAYFDQLGHATQVDQFYSNEIFAETLDEILLIIETILAPTAEMVSFSFWQNSDRKTPGNVVILYWEIFRYEAI